VDCIDFKGGVYGLRVAGRKGPDIQTSEFNLPSSVLCYLTFEYSDYDYLQKAFIPI